MPRTRGAKDRNILKIGEKVYDLFRKLDINHRSEMEEILKEAGIAFKIKGNRTFSKRYGKIPNEYTFEIVVKPERMQIIIVVQYNGKKVGEYLILNPDMLWDYGYLRLNIGEYHRFLKGVLRG